MVISEILTSLVMIFLLIIPGIIFRKKDIISAAQSDGISSLAVNITWPCLVVDAMQMDFSAAVLKDSGYMMAAAMVVFAMTAVVTLVLSKLLRLDNGKRYITAFMLLFGNTGFIGIPVIRALYGTEAVFFAAILEMVNDVVIFTIGMMLIQMSAGAKLRFEPKLFLNPGLIGVIVGLLLFLLDIRLPEVIGGAVEMVGDATTPLTMFLIGYQLGGLKAKEILKDASIYVISFTKLLIVPVLALIVLRVAVGDFSLLEKVLIMSFAMPAGSVSVIFSQQYRGETAFATKTVLLSTLFSIVTIPVFAVMMEM
ncbi:MAG TPA: AEC family transporter [Candidatus Copromorpha excrementipullorum]|uniref:AEC family transporter n=1 Tax=Candidatus Allocopromorpha excrementipullorum TaxID=2840743 RepID=A0A9D1N7W2_9FIRM|nr:AEC family transporter [Candidatus Copromorpha excrementipullorum]